MLKTNGTELIDESADVCLHFSGHVTPRPLEEYFIVFVGIRDAHTSFGQIFQYILSISMTVTKIKIKYS